MRRAIVPLTAALILIPAVAQAQSRTTRIETRPFYGATVTLEEGVRVFRPLPSHDRVIINPGGQTPLSLGIEDKRSVSHNYYYNKGASSAASASTGSEAGTPAYGVSGHTARGRGHHGGGRHHGGRSGSFVPR